MMLNYIINSGGKANADNKKMPDDSDWNIGTQNKLSDMKKKLKKNLQEQH